MFDNCESGSVRDSYAWGAAGEVLAAEYEHLVAVAQRFGERAARWSPAPTLPSALEIISHLAVELLPDGPAPSLSDALYALDRVYAQWQGEPPAYQRWQARHLVYHAAQLAMLAQLWQHRAQ